MFAIVGLIFGAVPIRWPVETSEVEPAVFSCYRGETLEMSASLLSYGRPWRGRLENVALYFQTNGMEDVYWKAPASVSSNVVSAVWSPTNDVGAAYYRCFIGDADSTYRAAFRLIMLDSPGFVPNTLELPVQAFDFEAVEVRHAPYYTRDEVDALIDAATAPTNVYTKTEVDAKVAEVSAPLITTTADGQTRRERGHVVYSNVMLFIREVPAANGELKYRLIRRSEE